MKPALQPNQTQQFILIVCPFEAHPQRLQPLFKSCENLIFAQKLNLDLRLGVTQFWMPLNNLISCSFR